MGPIAYLRLNKVEVRVKQVPFEPNFIFAFTGKSLDCIIDHGIDFCGSCCYMHASPLQD